MKSFLSIFTVAVCVCNFITGFGLLQDLLECVCVCVCVCSVDVGDGKHCSVVVCEDPDVFTLGLKHHLHVCTFLFPFLLSPPLKIAVDHVIHI